MSTADEAFDKLLDRSLLNIPVAHPTPESGGTGHMTATIPRAADMAEAVRTLDLLESGGDYMPRGGKDETDTEVGLTPPTESDLVPVDRAESVFDVFGREPMEDEDTELVYSEAAALGQAEPAPSEGSTRHYFGAEADLRLARRIRRFAYLPLAGMEEFESRARDMMASLASRDPDRPSLAITSPSRGEGQTELAIRLALALAKRVDYRILLADFDVRKPQVAARLGLSSKYFTLSDVLRGSCRLGEALMVSEEDNLYVLPSRPFDREGDEVLDGREVQALLDQLHATFDFSILGCGPADHADAGIVCRHAGATALAGFCGRTRADDLRRTAARLADGGATMAGLLLTGA